MKKNILFLLTLTSITTLGWTQSLPTNSGNTFSVSNFMTLTNGDGITSNWNGSYTNVGTETFPTYYGPNYYGVPTGVAYQRFNGPSGKILCEISNGTLIPRFVSGAGVNLGLNPDGSFNGMGNGMGGNYYWPGTNWFGTHAGGGIGPGYAAYLAANPPGASPSSSAVIAAQAADLNIGLTFQNGQWTPSQN